jgi:hypothetical protein
MPLLRYFMFVGGALLALLLVIAAAVPTSPAPETVASGGDVPPVRIRSDRKWPERIVLDTTQPTIAAPVVVQAAPKPAAAEMAANTRARESYAQLVPSDAKSPGAVAKKPQAPKRRVARAHRPMMIVAQQPRFGFGWFNTMW